MSYPIYKAIKRVSLEQSQLVTNYNYANFQDGNASLGWSNPYVFQLGMSGFANGGDNITVSQAVQEANMGMSGPGNDPQVYIDNIRIRWTVKQNDLESNSSVNEYFRFMVAHPTNKDGLDISDVQAQVCIPDITSTPEQTILSTLRRNDEFYTSNDTGWKKYNATLCGAMEGTLPFPDPTGAGLTDQFTFNYPSWRRSHNMVVKKRFSVERNGVLTGWKSPLLIWMFTGSSLNAPDIQCNIQVSYRYIV